MEIERGGHHHPLPDQHQGLQQPHRYSAEQVVPHSEPPVDVAQLLGDDEGGEGEEEAVPRDIQPGPLEARLVAGALGEVGAHPTDPRHLLYPGEQHLGEAIPDPRAQQESNPNNAGVRR